jgi:hypothetical protein
MQHGEGAVTGDTARWLSGALIAAPKMRFETCAVCTKSYSGSQGVGDVFGCIKWGFQVDSDSRRYWVGSMQWSQDKWYGFWGQSTGVGRLGFNGSGTRYAFSEPGQPPSGIMEDFLDHWFFGPPSPTLR